RPAASWLTPRQRHNDPCFFAGKRPGFRRDGTFHMSSKTDTPGSTEKRSTKKPSAGKTARQARLAEELRAKLARRKAQTRSRRTGGADERPDGLAGGEVEGSAGNDNQPSRN